MKTPLITRRPNRRQTSPQRTTSESSHEQAILNSLQAHIAVLDRGGTIVLVNAEWQKLSRENRAFWVARTRPGVNYLRLCKRMGTKAAGLLKGAQAILSGRQKSFACDVRCTSSSTEDWFHFSVTRPSTQIYGAVISCLEVTRQKKADAEMARLAAIVESSTDAVTAAGLDGTVTSWNKGAQQLYGYSAQEIVGRPIELLIPRHKRDEVQAVLRKIKAGRSVAPFETVRRHKKGRLIPVTVNISAVRDANGDIIALSGIARDVSERRRLEAEVLHAAEREQRRIAQDLHDGLTQQIAGVACLVSVLQQKLKAENLPQEAEARRIVQLLNDASEQSRDLSRGLYPVRPQPDGLMAALDALAIRTGELFHVNCHFQCRRPVLVKDFAAANHLYRIAQEAVANAVRHARASRIEVHLSASKDQLLLGVADDGIGIRKPRCARKGIGLRIMSYRAELISGTLSVQKRAQRGTEVVCTVNRHRHGS